MDNQPFQRESCSFYFDIDQMSDSQQHAINKETVCDIIKYHPMVQFVKMERFVAAYLTTFDDHAFVPVDVLGICMSFCGVIPQLLPSFNALREAEDHDTNHERARCVDIDYRGFIQFAISTVKPLQIEFVKPTRYIRQYKYDRDTSRRCWGWRMKMVMAEKMVVGYSAGYTRDIMDLRHVYTLDVFKNSFDILICARIDDKEGDGYQWDGIQRQNILQIAKVKCRGSKETSKIVWKGMGRKYQRCYSMAKTAVMDESASE